MTDEQSTISDLKKLVLDFSRERDWEQFHHPKDLAIAIAIEAGEVLEHFRFRGNEEFARWVVSAENKTAVAYELADVLWALLRLSDVMSVDLSAALGQKLVLAGEKYPVEESRGRSLKYTEYRKEQAE